MVNDGCSPIRSGPALALMPAQCARNASRLAAPPISTPISFLVTGGDSTIASGFAVAAGAALAIREAGIGLAPIGLDSFDVDAVTCGPGVGCCDDGGEAFAVTV